VQRDGFDTSKFASDCWRATLRRCHGVEPSLPWCGTGVAMVWNRRCHGVEPACGNDRAFPCRNGFEAYLCSVEWHAFSEAGTKKVGRKMRPTCVKVLFRWT
jgi:hypothetical protein